MLSSKLKARGAKQIPVGHWILFVIWCLVLGIYPAYALNLDKLKSYFLSGDYTQVIKEGEKILADAHQQPNQLDELYYILGLAYLKDGNYLRAGDIFEIILKEFKDSAFKEEAELGLGDIYFLKGEFDAAEKKYQEILKANPRTKLEAEIYYRLNQCAFKKGDTKQAKEYLDKLNKNFPLSLEAWLTKDLSVSQLYYTVQVGAFSSSRNAENLKEKLAQKGYSAYIEKITKEEKINYRVRIGKFTLRLEAQEAADKLSSEGYAVKIFP